MILIEKIIASYEQEQSVWKAGKKLGICGQAVYRRLKRAGYPVNTIPTFTKDEKRKIKNYYETATFENFDLQGVAEELGRPKTSVCMIAKKMGLTKQGRSTKKIIDAGRAGGRGKWSKRPHPRGFLGKKHPPEALRAISEASRLSWATAKTFGIGSMSQENRDRMSRQSSLRAASRPSSAVYTRAKGGHRADLGGQFFRSSWEANYARYLNLLKRFGVVESWAFEPETFWFDGIRRGTMSYKPDFRVTYRGDDMPEYIEIKGWVTAKDQTKWARMAKYHPGIKLVVVKAKEYYAIQRKWASAIPEWE